MRAACAAKTAAVVVAFSALSYACLSVVSAVLITMAGWPDVSCVGLGWVRRLGALHVGAAVACEVLAIWLCLRSAARGVR